MLKPVLLIAIVACSASSFAAEPQEVIASITMNVVIDGKKTEIKGDVVGKQDQPLKTTIKGANGSTLDVSISKVADSNPVQYFVKFRLKRESKTLAEPTIVSSVRRPIQFFVGREDGDHTRVTLIVRNK